MEEKGSDLAKDLSFIRFSADLQAVLNDSLSLDLFELLELKGGGSNGSVFRARCRKIPYLDFAMKICYNLGVEDTAGLMNAYKNEYDILIAIPTHPNVNRIFTHFTDLVPPELAAKLPDWPQQVAREGKKSLFLVMPYMHQTLREWRDLHAPTVAQQIQILLQLLGAAVFLECHGVVHLDMKLNNILVEDTPAGPVVQIADFGEAKRLPLDRMEQSYEHDMRIGGNMAHLAPELQSAFLQRTTLPFWKQASFALGAVAVELATGKHPLDSYPVGFQRGLVVSYTPGAIELPENWPPQLAAIVREMLLPDPEERLPLPAALGRLRGFDAIGDCRLLQTVNEVQAGGRDARRIVDQLVSEGKQLRERNEELQAQLSASTERLEMLQARLAQQGGLTESKHEEPAEAHEAAKSGDFKALAGIKLRALDGAGNAPAVYAIQRADREAIEHLFTHGGCPIALEWILDQGIRPVPCLRYLNAAYLAVANGFADCLPLLWKAVPGMFKKKKKKDGTTVVHVAAQKGHLECLQFLWPVAPELFSSPKKKTKVTVAHIAAQHGHLDCLAFLVEKAPELLSQKKKGGATVAHIAAQFGRLECLQFLFSAIPQLLQETNEDGETVAFIAAQNGHRLCLEYLWGVDPELFYVRTDCYDTVVKAACYEDRVDCLEYLWTVIPELFSNDQAERDRPYGGETVAMCAGNSGSIKCIKFLWDVFPSVFYETDNLGNSAPYASSWSGQLEIMKFIWSVAPELFEVERGGRDTYARTAVDNGFPEIAQWARETIPPPTGPLTPAMTLFPESLRHLMPRKR